MRDKERRQRAARMKKLVYGTFSGIRILRQLDIATPAYWLCSAAVVRSLASMLEPNTRLMSYFSFLCVGGVGRGD